MNRQPTTMTVIYDGKEVWREIAAVEFLQGRKRYIPQLRPGEAISWDRNPFHPTIIAETNVCDDYAHCPVCELPFFINKCTRCGHEQV